MSKLSAKLTVISLILFITACDKTNTAQAGAVVWYEAFTLPAMLENAVEVKQQEDIKKLLTANWYSAFEVRNPLTTTKKDIKTIHNCQDYFNYPGLTTVNPPDYGPYLGIGVMCKAARIISEAQPYQNSRMTDLHLDAQLPNKLPKQVATVISTSERNKISADQSKVYWSDVEKITKVEIKGAHKASYSDAGGEQDIELLARGDFNHDGLEDWLITSNYAVKDGTYRAVRMFVITKTAADGKIQLLEEISQ